MNNNLRNYRKWPKNNRKANQIQQCNKNKFNSTSLSILNQNNK